MILDGLQTNILKSLMAGETTRPFPLMAKVFNFVYLNIFPPLYNWLLCCLFWYKFHFEVQRLSFFGVLHNANIAIIHRLDKLLPRRHGQKVHQKSIHHTSHLYFGGLINYQHTAFEYMSTYRAKKCVVWKELDCGMKRVVDVSSPPNWGRHARFFGLGLWANRSNRGPKMVNNGMSSGSH